MTRASLALCIVLLSVNVAMADHCNNMTCDKLVPDERFVTDTLFTTDAALLTADFFQTRGISSNCNSGGGYWETNPVMGRCPTMHGVNQYFLAASGVLIGLNWMLPKQYRDTYLIGIGVTEGAFVAQNLKLGVRMHY